VEHLDPDEMVLLALGERATTEHFVSGGSEPSQSPEQHLRECAVCRTELAQLTHTVQLAREAGELGLQAPVVLPASIWNGIAGDLGIGAASDSGSESDARVPGQRLGHPPRSGEQAAPTDDRRPPAGGRHLADHRDTRRRSWRRGLLIAAVVVAVGIGTGTGVAIGRRDAPPVVALQSQAVLKPIATGPATAHGMATVTQGIAGTTLRVAARELPLRQGYYEVWLYNPQADKMVAVGTLGSGGDGIWTLASTIDLRSYSVVNVSAQDFDGNPAHKDSVLQGALTE
jgi:hypothetical protein